MLWVTISEETHIEEALALESLPGQSSGSSYSVWNSYTSKLNKIKRPFCVIDGVLHEFHWHS